MKTKIRTFITVCALAAVGVLNANAAANSGEKNTGWINANESLSTVSEETASPESELNESIDYRKEAQMITKWIADVEEAKATKKVMERSLFALNEATYSTENEVVNENLDEMTDFSKEAQLMIRLAADREEAKATQRVMERGLAASNETIAPFGNEVENEINDEITGFSKEVQLMTKLAADKEEAKALQKLVAEGKLAENK